MPGATELDGSAIETLDAAAGPAETLEELYEQVLPTLAARIWNTCCWPARMADGWKMGDFKFLVVSVSPEPRTNLYVQFWSEPGEIVLVEVCSGEWSPGSVKYVQQRQRELLRALGFRIGGEARNFSKEIGITNVAQAETAARETLRIFYEAFGYRGQWPLELQFEPGERAEYGAVYSSVTPEDVEKLLAEHGYPSAVAMADDGPVIVAQRGRRRFMARPDRRLPKTNLYAAIRLDTLVRPARPVTDEAILALTSELPGLTIGRHGRQDLRLSMPLVFDGGVTDGWIVRSVQYWIEAVRRCERLLRAGGRCERPVPRRPRQPQVH
jgi:hypothetical protein